MQFADTYLHLAEVLASTAPDPEPPRKPPSGRTLRLVVEWPASGVLSGTADWPEVRRFVDRIDADLLLASDDCGHPRPSITWRYSEGGSTSASRA